MIEKETGVIIRDGWHALQQYTAARIALGRTGVSVPAKEMLGFKMAHAHARDAVFSLLEIETITEQLRRLSLEIMSLKSRAGDRHSYLQRPDWGRRLNDLSAKALSSLLHTGSDVCITIADGLSAEAINRHAVPVMQQLLPMLAAKQISIAPVCLVENGRVAISDETGSLLQAKLSLILIGERPGLSSPDSMGAYLTFAPAIGVTDESRNCVSNIRPEGLPYSEAAFKIYYLVSEALRLQQSGIGLKDNSSNSGLPDNFSAVPTPLI